MLVYQRVTLVIPQFLSTSLGKNWAEMRSASFLPQLSFGAIQQTLGLARWFLGVLPMICFGTQIKPVNNRYYTLRIHVWNIYLHWDYFKLL